MKTKLLSIAFVMSTVCTMWSQDTISNTNWNLEFANRDLPPVSFPFWMAREIALDLEEKNRLQQEVQLLWLEKETLARLVSALEQKDRNRLLQLELFEKNKGLLEIQLQAEKKINKGDWITWILRVLGAFGAGFLLGRI